MNFCAIFFAFGLVCDSFSFLWSVAVSPNFYRDKLAIFYIFRAFQQYTCLYTLIPSPPSMVCRVLEPVIKLAFKLGTKMTWRRPFDHGDFDHTCMTSFLCMTSGNHRSHWWRLNHDVTRPPTWLQQGCHVLGLRVHSSKRPCDWLKLALLYLGNRTVDFVHFFAGKST